MHTVITVSRQLGSLGSYIAAAVAQKLQLRYLDREILHRAAEAAGYPDETMITYLENKEKIPGLIGRVLNILATIPPVPAIPSATLREHHTHIARTTSTDISQEKAIAHLQAEYCRAEIAKSYAELVQKIILRYAQVGNAMIVGRGGQVILRDIPGVLHVQIIASEKIRSRRVSQRMKLNLEEAAERVQQDDRNRRRYIKHFHDTEWQDPNLYDLILNTDKISADLAVRIISQTAKEIADKSPKKI